MEAKYVYAINVNKEFCRKGNHAESIRRWFQVLNGIWDYVFDDYGRKDQLIKVVGGSTKNDRVVFEMRVVEFLIHMILWRPNVVFEVPIERDDFHELHPLTSRKMGDILDAISRKFVQKNFSPDAISYTISHVIESFSLLSEAYSSIACNTFSLWDVMQFEDRSPVFKSLINTQLDENLPIKDIERYLKKTEGILMEAIKQDRQTSLYPYVQSARLDRMQLNQMFVAVGPRPDIDKTILPRIIKGNFLKGLQDIGEYYVEAVSARDALLTKHNNVRISGYLSRKINILCLNTSIDWAVDNCQSKNYVSFDVFSEDHLRMIVGKYQVLPDGNLHEVQLKDKYLLGQTVKFRSHICCALKETGKVCKTCYGAHHKTVYGTQIGGLPAIKFANPMSQRSMSAKHKMGTNSIEITNEFIKKFFDIDTSYLYPKLDLIKTPDCFLVFDRENLDDALTTDNIEIDGETAEEVSIPLENIRVRVGEEEFAIENDGLFLSLADEIASNPKTFLVLDEAANAYILPVKKLDVQTPIFSIILITEEISRYLTQVLQIIDGGKTKSYASYDDIVRDIVKVIIDSGMSIYITHIETILYNMVRDNNAITRRPDFLEANPKHVLLSVSQSILKKDMYTSLSFQGLKDQFRDVNSFIKTGHGIFDPFFKVTPYKYYPKKAV